VKVAGRYVALAGLLVLCVSVVGRGEPTTQPSKEAKPAHWGFDPYNKLTTLTAEQKSKITEIHHKALADKKAIEDKEEADIMALLTPDQKADLEKLNADKKAKGAEKRRAAKDEKNGKDKDASGEDADKK
jgi:Spy/CpxP family protein refolding chaperone